MPAFFVGTIAATPGSRQLDSKDSSIARHQHHLLQPGSQLSAVAVCRTTFWCEWRSANPVAARFNALKAADGTVNLTAIRRTPPGELICLAYLREHLRRCRRARRIVRPRALLPFEEECERGLSPVQNNDANYEEYSINTRSSFSEAVWTYTDCKAKPGECTQAEEQQNFANWFTYYRSRAVDGQRRDRMARLDRLTYFDSGTADQPGERHECMHAR